MYSTTEPGKTLSREAVPGGASLSEEQRGYASVDITTPLNTSLGARAETKLTSVHIILQTMLIL